MPNPILSEPEFGTPPLPPGMPAGRTPTYETIPTAQVSQPEDRVVPVRALRDLPLLFDGDFLFVENVDIRPAVFRWARKTYTVMPGEKKPVMFEALVNQLGDPRSQDNAVTKYADGQGDKGIVLRRHDEITRLFAIYGIRNERISESGTNPHTGEFEPSLVEMAPKVRVTTLNDVSVTFPASQPDMHPFPVQNLDPLAVTSDQSRVNAQMSAENEEMRARLERMEGLLEATMREREGVQATTGS
jgi:hypothetical protein